MSGFFKLTEQEQKVLETLKKSDVKSRPVVGRGTLTLNPEDITRSEKFKQYLKQSSELVRANQNQ